MMAEDVTQMLSDCSAIVASVMPEREPFFPNSEGGFYGKRGLEKTFRQVLKKAAITGTGRRSPRLYDFRHTFATHRLYRWMREGKDLNAMLPYLMSLLGVLVALIGAKDSAYVQFHVKQALRIHVLSILLAVVIALLFWTIIVAIAGAVCLIILEVLAIIGFFQVCGNKAKELAIIRGMTFLK